jgi:hypothetical protein
VMVGEEMSDEEVKNKFQKVEKSSWQTHESVLN